MNRTKIEELRKRLQRHGYQLYKVTSFKKHDRVTFGNKNIKISVNLRGKLSEIALETLIHACVGSMRANSFLMKHPPLIKNDEVKPC